jgi:hypothetical protein
MTPLVLSDRQAATVIYLATVGSANDARLWRVAGATDVALDVAVRLGLLDRTPVGGRGHVYRLTPYGELAARSARVGRRTDLEATLEPERSR